MRHPRPGQPIPPVSAPPLPTDTVQPDRSVWELADEDLAVRLCGRPVRWLGYDVYMRLGAPTREQS